MLVWVQSLVLTFFAFGAEWLVPVNNHDFNPMVLKQWMRFIAEQRSTYLFLD